jgi:hypothetical protein
MFEHVLEHCNRVIVDHPRVHGKMKIMFVFQRIIKIHDTNIYKSAKYTLRKEKKQMKIF